MASTKEEFAAQWRASAHEAVPYTDDFPECLLVLPELYDGSLNQGNATEIRTEIDLPLPTSGSMATLRIRDNGRGITNLTRLLSWASKTNTDISHRYGHGSKKMLTKWMRDHETAKWSVQWRTVDKRGVSGSLHTLTGPFLGHHTKHDEDGDNETALMPSGTEWNLTFDPNILGDYRSADNLFGAIKEIICSKYSSIYLEKCAFILTIRLNGIIVKEESSTAKKWLTFQQQLHKEIKEKRAIISRYKTVKIEGGHWTATEYKLLTEGKALYPLKQYFPHYGPKNMKAARVHVALKGRTIEAIPLYKLAGREANHNDFNGRIVLVNFESVKPEDYECLPTPCTTKVSFYKNCPIFKKFQSDFGDFLKERELEQVKEPESHPLTKKEIEDMSCDGLKAELAKLDLSKTGLKYELQNRLTNHLFPKKKTEQSNATTNTNVIVSPSTASLSSSGSSVTTPAVSSTMTKPTAVSSTMSLPVPPKPNLAQTVSTVSSGSTTVPSKSTSTVLEQLNVVPKGIPFTLEINGYTHHLTLPKEKNPEDLLVHIRSYLKV
jgi:hypothetical protein